MFNGYRISEWDDGKVLKMYSGDSCTMRMALNATKLNTQNSQNGNFILCILYHNEKNECDFYLWL